MKARDGERGVEKERGREMSIIKVGRGMRH